MPNNPADDRPRKKRQTRGAPRRQGQRRDGAPDNVQRQPGQGQPRTGRLSREEIEWARDLWQHGEPADEIANQLGVEIGQVEELIAGWTK